MAGDCPAWMAPGRLPDPRSIATAAVALAQLGRVEQEEELMKHLVQCGTGDTWVPWAGDTRAKNPAFLALASEEELKDLQGRELFSIRKMRFGTLQCPGGSGGPETGRETRFVSTKDHFEQLVLAKDVHRVSVALPKKRATTTNYDKALVRFFEQVYQGIKDHVNLDLVKCVLLAGPGFVKDDFLSWMIQKATQSGDTLLLQKKSNFVSVHASCVHKQALKELLSDEQAWPDRVCYGPKQVVDSLFRNANVKLRRQ
eukprot:Skav203570  [mRNA]  locus=scaffold3576:274934:280744:+ [translate_table: standard]